MMRLSKPPDIVFNFKYTSFPDLKIIVLKVELNCRASINCDDFFASTHHHISFILIHQIEVEVLIDLRVMLADGVAHDLQVLCCGR